MKKITKIISAALATLFILFTSLSTFATGTSSQNSNQELSAPQVVAAFALLVFVIVLPLVKSARKNLLQNN